MNDRAEPIANKAEPFEDCLAYLDFSGTSIDVHRHEDFTVVLSDTEYEGLEKLTTTPVPTFKDLATQSKSMQLQLPVRLETGDPTTCGTIEGRSLICRCKIGGTDYASITFRLQRKLQFSTSVQFEGKAIESVSFSSSKQRAAGDPAKREALEWEPKPPDSKYPIPFKSVVDKLLPTIPHEGRFPHGLIVVAGATGTGKSQIAKGLMLRFLDERWKDPRRPHIVTFEDPVESPCFYKNLAHARQWHYDYTAREKVQPVIISKGQNGDYPTLAVAVKDAMRQTPAVFYCGEARENSDWKHLLWLANTGHLVVTTTHASSVIDFFKKLSGAVDFKTPANRSNIANRICAVIHMESFKMPMMSDGEVALKTLALPSICGTTPRSVSELVADGLASIAPHVLPKSLLRLEDIPVGCLGRSFFANEFKSILESSGLNAELVTRMAIRSDLLGT